MSSRMTALGRAALLRLFGQAVYESAAMSLSRGWKKSREIRDDLCLNIGLHVKRRTPIIVYQMGKVGSNSVAESLKSCGVDGVFRVHRMNPDNIKRVRQEFLDAGQRPLDEALGERLYRSIATKRRKAKFITLVREPIGRNMAAFFQNFRRFTGIEYSDADFNIDELVNMFVHGYPHSVPLTWFDVEMRETLGIDVYEYPFPREKGYLSVRKGNFDLLILKCEVDDATKEKAIAEFLNVGNIKLLRSNVGQDKDYAQTYQEFVRAIALPESYIQTMCNSRYVRHFYSDAEIERIRSRWCSSLEPGQ